MRDGWKRLKKPFTISILLHEWYSFALMTSLYFFILRGICAKVFSINLLLALF